MFERSAGRIATRNAIVSRNVVLALMAALFSVLIITGCNVDRTPPTVAITQPTDGATLSGIIGIQAKATDDRSTPVVDFFVDGTLKGTDSTGVDSIYSYSWDASALDTGSVHKIKATATDAAGNLTTSPEITITIGVALGPTNHRGAITHREIWDPRGNPHIITGDLTIANVVTIRPGVEVRVDSAVRINLSGNGGLFARGTGTEPIVFTTNVQPAPGKWDGISIQTGVQGDSVAFEFCTIEYGGKDTLGANLTLSGTPLSIRNCTIRKSAGYGIRANGNNLREFAANTVVDNARAPIRIDSRYVGSLGIDNQLGGNGRNIEVVGGQVLENSTWYDLGAPYTMMTDLVVGYRTGVVLHLNPGVNLRFRPGHGLTVGGPDSATLGGLFVDGTAGDPVVFTSDSSLPNPGDWPGVRLGHIRLGDSVWINYARIEYAGANGFGAIYLDSAPARITNTTIRNSSANGVFAANGGFSEFTGNDISQCAAYPVHIEPEYVRTIGSNNLANSPYSGVLVASGQVRTTGTWHHYSFPYVVNGFVDVTNDSKPVLTLAAGDSLIFLSGSGLRVGTFGYGERDSGALIADQVVLTSVTPQVYWKGLEFQNNTLDQQSILSNSIIRFGGADTFGDILCQDAAPTIVGDSITDSQSYGIYLFNSPLNRDTLLFYNHFRNNASGDIFP